MLTCVRAVPDHKEAPQGDTGISAALAGPNLAGGDLKVPWVPRDVCGMGKLAPLGSEELF